MRAGWATVLAVLAPACDQARDVDYRGEVELAFDCEIVVVPEELTPEEAAGGRLGAALAWSSRDGRIARVDPVFTACDAGRCRVEVYARAPASALRESAAGAYALGEVFFFADRDGDGRWRGGAMGETADAGGTGEAGEAGEAILGRISHVVDAPGGSDDVRFAAPLSSGLTLVDAMWPCDDARARFVVAPPGDVRVARTRMRFFARYDEGLSSFADPACAAKSAAFVLECPAFAAIRQQCRQGDPASELCARCEYLAFPIAATPFMCGEWRSRWNSRDRQFRHNRRLQEVLVEEALCRLGEPAPSVPACDLACACDKRRALCVATNEGTPASCDDEREACLLY